MSWLNLFKSKKHIPNPTAYADATPIIPDILSRDLATLLDNALRDIDKDMDVLGCKMLYTISTTFAVKVPMLDPKKFNIETQQRKTLINGVPYINVGVIIFTSGGKYALLVCADDILRESGSEDGPDEAIIKKAVLDTYSNDVNKLTGLFVVSNKRKIASVVEQVVLSLNIEDVNESRKDSLNILMSYVTVITNIVQARFSNKNLGVRSLVKCKLVYGMFKDYKVGIGLSLTNPFTGKEMIIMLCNKEVNSKFFLPSLELAFDQKKLREYATKLDETITVIPNGNANEWYVIDVTKIDTMYEVEEILGNALDVVLNNYLYSKV